MNTNAKCIRGDFIGFTLGDIHSSELGLVRVSDGSRYNEDLLPPLQDKKAQVAGRDGEVYFGSQYVTKPIRVPVAFDNMNEFDISRLRKLISIKTPQILWFDEHPYKQWLVKSATAQSFKWLCFDESNRGRDKRVYKGEGTLEFSCFTPHATSRFTYLNDAGTGSRETFKPRAQYSNFYEWCEGSGLRWKEETIKTVDYTNGYNIEYGIPFDAFKIDDFDRRGIFVYNAGDIEIKPKIICKIPPEYSTTQDILLRIYSMDNSQQSALNQFFPIGEITISKEIIAKTRQNKDTHIILDSKLKMIKGAIQVDDIQQLTGNIYNKYHKSGDYLEIPVSSSDIYFIEIIEKGLDDKENPKTQDVLSDDLIKIESVEYVHQYY